MISRKINFQNCLFSDYLDSVRVKLAAVRHSDASVEYMKTDLVGQPVFFKLLAREDDGIADCIVRFQKVKFLGSEVCRGFAARR